MKVEKKLVLENYIGRFEQRKKISSTLTDLNSLIAYSINGMCHIRDLYRKEIEGTGKKIELPEAYPIMLYNKNCHYIVGAYEMISLGLINPSNSLQRTILEDIWIMYFTAFDSPENIKNYHILNFYKFYTLHEQDIFKGQYDKEIESINWRDYTYKKICSRVYKTDTSEKMYEKVYSILSDSVHSSITGTARDGEFSIDKIKEHYEFLLILIYNNISALFEIYQKTTLEKHKDIIGYILNNIAQYFNYSITPFCPDSDEYKMKFIPSHKYFKK